MSSVKQVFVVGSSRSGTTMMGRILGNHSDIFSFNELHFFGTIWTNKTPVTLTKKDQIALLSRLLCIQERGLFKQQDLSDFKGKAQVLLMGNNLSPIEIYQLFLNKIIKENNASIACEQTPKNMYYLEEILSFFPNAKVVNMVRDQRDVLLSQKNKWKRKFLGSTAIPLSESVRSFVNYHPLFTAKIWSSSVRHTLRYRDNEKVKIVKFEELLKNPKGIIHEICAFLEIDFQDAMLEVPVIGSSTEMDNKGELKIDSSKIYKWRNGGLTMAEIYLSQKMSYSMLLEFDYPLKKFLLPPFLSGYYLLIFPVKLALAFLFNIHRMANIVEVIKKRFFIK